MPNKKLNFELVLFGGLGDLSSRKLIPSLYMLCRDGRLGLGKIYLVTRQTIARNALVERVQRSIAKYVSVAHQDEASWWEFADMLECITLEASNPDSFSALAAKLDESITNRIFYLATGSELYSEICLGLSKQELLTSTSKVVLEKPIGKDYTSAAQISELVKRYFVEEQIYRIDHYLGKETVQNLLALRFANSIFEHQWSREYIDHIQITISESIGIEGRADFYETVGATRDMFQNHLLQLLCITAMEPPVSLNADAIRDEKVKVIKALKPLTLENLCQKVVLGQYAGYLDEAGVQPNSQTETFVAVKVEIENWRWAGVPFYLRTGKKLAERLCEIEVNFKAVPHSMFPSQDKESIANKLIFRLQPDDGIRMQLYEKRIGPGMRIRPVKLNLNPSYIKEKRVPDAYERLLYDVIRGNQTLFLREDELVSAWQWLDPLLEYLTMQPPESYKPLSWGPNSAKLLLKNDNRRWSEES